MTTPETTTTTKTTARPPRRKTVSLHDLSTAVDVPIWIKYTVELQFDGPFGASLPKNLEEIKRMLFYRQPEKKPENAIPLEQLAEEVAAAVGTSTNPDDKEEQPGWATMPHDDKGLYFEGRCIRGHLKDCAKECASFFPTIAGFKAKFSNRVYLKTQRNYLQKDTPDGEELRFIHVMTPQGERSSYKMVDYVLSPKLTFTLLVMNDGLITENHLRRLFEYGGVHGMGVERSQEWGKYDLVSLTKVP